MKTLYKKICGIAAVLFVWCNVASANVYPDDIYLGGGVGFLKLSASRSGAKDYSLKTAYFKMGKYFTEVLSGEFRLGVGVGDDSNVYSSTFDSGGNAFYDAGEYTAVEKETIDLDKFFGLYIRASMQSSETFNPYLLFGYTKSESTVKEQVQGRRIFDTNGNSVNDNPYTVTDEFDLDGSSVSFGVGADINISPNVFLNLEYMQYIDDKSRTGTPYKIAGYSIALVHTF